MRKPYLKKHEHKHVWTCLPASAKISDKQAKVSRWTHLNAGMKNGLFFLCIHVHSFLKQVCSFRMKVCSFGTQVCSFQTQVCSFQTQVCSFWMKVIALFKSSFILLECSLVFQRTQFILLRDRSLLQSRALAFSADGAVFWSSENRTFCHCKGRL